MIKSIEKSLKILEVLSQNKRFYGVTEIADILNFDKSVVFKMLKTFENHGYVEQEKNTKKYGLGLKILELSNKLLQRINVIEIARPALMKIREFTGETVHLATLNKEKVIYLDQLKSNEVISVNTQVGNFEPIYCTAAGKSILAFLDINNINYYLDIFSKEGFTKFTKNTITSKDELSKELKRIRKEGFAIDNEELHYGVKCLAVPIKNQKKEVIASLGISGPVARLDDNKILVFSKYLMKEAKEVSRKLGEKI